MQDDFNARFEFNDESLRRHGINRRAAVEVVEADYSETFPLSRNQGNDRVMFVGFADMYISLLEVGMEFLNVNGKKKIFHANKARKYFTNMFNERKGL